MLFVAWGGTEVSTSGVGVEPPLDGGLCHPGRCGICPLLNFTRREGDHTWYR